MRGLNIPQIFGKLLANVLDILLEFILFVLWLLLLLLWGKKLNRLGFFKHRDVYKNPECSGCPIHCPPIFYKLHTSVKPTPSISSHPINQPEPPSRSTSGKLTQLQIVRLKIQKELNKPSDQVNIKKVRELQKKEEELKEKWRKMSRAQKRAWKRRNKAITRKTVQKSPRSTRPSYPPMRDASEGVQKQPTSLSSIPEKLLVSISWAKSGYRKFTRLQLTRNQLKKELSKPSESINIDRVKRLRKRVEKLEQEWHNRSKSQKRAWRWRKRVAEIVKQNLIDKRGQYLEVFQRPSGSHKIDRRTCLRCFVHCSSVRKLRGHWKGKFYELLIGILEQLESEKSLKITGGEQNNEISKLTFWRKITRWLSFRYISECLFQKIKDVCLRVYRWIMQYYKEKLLKI
jgi:hypothetical protein